MRKKIMMGMIALGMLGGVTEVYGTPFELNYDGQKHIYELPPITLHINGELIETNVMPPVQIEEVTLVPVREVFEPLGAFIEWKEEEKKVYINYKDMLLILEMDTPEVWLNGEISLLDVPAKTINNKIMVPVRFISERLGFEVRWDGEIRKIDISIPIEEEPQLEPEIGLDVEVGPEIEEPEESRVIDLSELFMVYESREQILTMDLREQIAPNMRVEDHYIQKKIIIDLGDDYSAEFEETIGKVEEAVIQSIEIKNDETTQIILQMNGIYVPEVIRQEEVLQIRFVKPKDKYEKILFLDAGHGGRAPGSMANNLVEKEVNLKQTLAVKEFVENNTDIKVYLTRIDDADVSVEERPYIANEIGADLFVSIHNNSADLVEANGTEVLYYPDKVENINKEIAEIFQKKLVEYGGLRDRGAKPSVDLWVLKMSEMPAVLIEGGFLSNAEDAIYLGDEAFNLKYAYAVYEAIVEIFNKL